jgi:enamine deaminase RidA (YjgF/YER057c/UK114 family)
VRQTFVNIGQTLSKAGAAWTDVVELASYHVGLQSQLSTVLKVAAEFLTDPYPAWTSVGVTELIVPEARIEVSCVAVLGRGRRSSVADAR